MESLHRELSPLLDTCPCPRLLRTPIGVEMENRPGTPGLLVPLLGPTGTYAIRFTLVRRKQAWLNNKLVMDKSSDDPVVLRELANVYVTAELVNLIFDVSVQPNGIH